MNLGTFTGPVTIVSPRIGPPGRGEVFEARPEIIRRNRWITVAYNGKRIAKVIPGPDAEAQIQRVVDSVKEAQREAVERHNAQFGASAEYGWSHDTLESGDEVSVTGLSTVLPEAVEEAKEAAHKAEEFANGATEGAGEAKEAAHKAEEIAQTIEGVEPLTSSQTEAPVAVASSVVRRPSRKRK